MLIHVLTYNIHGLPWSNTNHNRLLAWVLQTEVPLLCFQEAFTATARTALRRLETYGYRIIIPRDEGVTLFPSGLVTAVQTSEFDILNDTFRPFLYYSDVEVFANKGFQPLHLRHKASGNCFHIVNTHLQSDEELLTWTRYSYKKEVRRHQAQQIIDHCKDFRDPVLVVGDFNQESSLHANLRILHPPSTIPLRKATFFRTGEDLDHVAWMPLQWVGAKEGCAFCGVQGPTLEFCKVHPVTWSDHAPVEMKVQVQ